MDFLREDVTFIQEVKYGFVAVDEDDNIIHFCGFSEKPGEDERNYFQEDLDQSIEMGLLDDFFEVRDATEEEIAFFKEVSLKEAKAHLN